MDQDGILLLYQFNLKGYGSYWFHINKKIVLEYLNERNARMVFFFGDYFVIIPIQIINQWIKTVKSYDYGVSTLFSFHFIEEGSLMIAQFAGRTNYDVTKYTKDCKNVNK